MKIEWNSDGEVCVNGGVWRNPTPLEKYLAEESGRLVALVHRAHEQLSKYDNKGPKQVGRAMMTLEEALGIARELS